MIIIEKKINLLNNFLDIFFIILYDIRSRKTPNGEFKDIAHPINAETREKIQKAILEAYDAPEAEAAPESAEEEK